jgi:hypothetical protein
MCGRCVPLRRVTVTVVRGLAVAVVALVPVVAVVRRLSVPAAVAVMTVAHGADALTGAGKLAVIIPFK